MTLPVKLVRTIPHNPNDFIQGLVVDGGVLYESTGLRGQSALKKLDAATGQVLTSHSLPGNWFGEGLVIHQGRLYQLTWTQGICQLYDPETLTPLKRFLYRGEGWGLAVLGEQLVMSDGSSELTLRDASTFKVQGVIPVREGSRPVTGLNELEVGGGAIYANILGDNRIAKINVATGQVEAWLNIEPIARGEQRGAGRKKVLNGIAYLPESGHLLITGKNWRYFYEVKVK